MTFRPLDEGGIISYLYRDRPSPARGTRRLMRAHLKIEKGEGRPSVCNLDPERPATLGRSLESTIVLHDEHVSRRHAEVALQDNRWLVRDFETPNGTRVNGERIENATFLEDGQEIGIGGVTLRFLLGAAENGAAAGSDGATEPGIRGRPGGCICT